MKPISNKNSRYDLLSVDLGWSEGLEDKKDLSRIALSFLNTKKREIFCTSKPYLCIEEFLSLLRNLKTKGIVLLDLPLKGKTDGFFRPVERVMQHAGIPCRPSKNVLVRGKRLSSKIESLGFKTIEIYPFEIYKFLSLIPIKKPDYKKEIRIEPKTFKRFFPSYKRAGEKGLKDAEKIVKRFLKFLNLKLIKDRNLILKNQNIKWDIYDSLFGAITGFLLLMNSPWAKLVKDKTGTEILLLVDENLRDFLYNNNL